MGHRAEASRWVSDEGQAQLQAAWPGCAAALSVPCAETPGNSVPFPRTAHLHTSPRCRKPPGASHTHALWTVSATGGLGQASRTCRAGQRSPESTSVLDGTRHRAPRLAGVRRGPVPLAGAEADVSFFYGKQEEVGV